mmetsp:Transcript_10729/g.32259  ORF Transcript_10729/g.32259 Transcript_10729/m.32259 type:complete len:142 (+) Transcript_10729:476-901(+)
MEQRRAAVEGGVVTGTYEQETSLKCVTTTPSCSPLSSSRSKSKPVSCSLPPQENSPRAHVPNDDDHDGEKRSHRRSAAAEDYARSRVVVHVALRRGHRVRGSGLGSGCDDHATSPRGREDARKLRCWTSTMATIKVALSSG